MILIIRHKNSDKEFQRALNKNNFNYLYEPVLKFNYIKKKIINSEKKIFIIASIQAVKSMYSQKKEYLNLIKDAQFIVVGNKVTEALIKLGVKNIIKSFDTSKNLLRHIDNNSFYKKKKFEYLCGSVINEDFVNEMKVKKFSLRKKIIYQTKPLNQISMKSQTAFKKNNINIILLYSVYSAKVFLRLMRKNGLFSKLSRDVKFLCFSERISDKLSHYKSLQNLNISSIKSPKPELLLKSVKKIYYS